MRIYEEDEVIYLEKTCPEHGKFEDVYWGDAELYKWFFRNWYTAKYVGDGLENSHTEIVRGCPYDCGLCPQHKTHTVLGIIDVTNRCNMACPICFAYAGAANYIYEPSYDQIVEMIRNLRNNKPWACNALQFSGGEPTLGKEHLLRLLELLDGKGFTFILETNGIPLAYTGDYAARLSRFRFVHVRVSLKGCNEEEFARLTGARPEGFQLQLKALKKLVQHGVSCHASVMASFSARESLEKLVERLLRIDRRLAEDIEIEELILYPHVKEKIRKYGLKYYTGYEPNNVPREQI